MTLDADAQDYTDPLSWSDTEKGAMKALKAGLNTAALSIQQMRDAQAAAPPYPTPTGIKITPVSVPRTPVAGLEDDASGTFPAEWIEKEDAGEDTPVLIYYHGG
ncbi:hypothetical protein M427DRAFT_35456 [Gonapodya prolifera JEL478]|uniref:Alpha/beta hydrolase fold-3 domain-containing protein n=1 Tax=Gonapodya prolifera (strain JEL478) TaxID=1344416 RepID=A0A139A4G3_GONPJ|nr:hypothetical protein M427DRAFT_35456 [Gonapodya prolifera JEL478]|eukprot:KXS11706.1 hypothetical protein M427DRAFT_35456 [Gonapodya prolifera JEL478]